MGSRRRITIFAIGLGLVGIGAWGAIFSWCPGNAQSIRRPSARSKRESVRITMAYTFC